MQKSFDSAFFSFLVGDVLMEIASVSVTVPDGTWALSDSLVLRSKTRGLFQIIADLDGQCAVDLRDERDVQVRGDYKDLIASSIRPLAPPVVRLPDKVNSVVEFHSFAGKLIGAEIQLEHGAFSVLLFPEDIEVRSRGAIWDFVREYGLSELQQVVVLRAASET
jgi:hypothetical protein